MTQNSLRVADNVVVGIDYKLHLDDGELVDHSDTDAPLEYLHGHGNIIPGLEQALNGLQLGEEKDVSITPENGYGDYDEEAHQQVPISAFPDDFKLEPGMEIHMQDSETGQVLQAYVVEVRPEGALLDLNHPLAGETLNFQVKIASLRTATSEELDHGHVHGPGHDH